ncbi:MAG: hypothetical protein R3F11_09665 [Verrucomicrobiales bacterium]
MFLRLALSLGLAAAAWFALRGADGGAANAAVERTYLDWLIGNSSQKLDEPDVAFVRMDAETDAGIFEAWPYSPKDYAVLFGALRNGFNARTIAAAEPLSWLDAAPDDLAILHDQAIPVPRLILGMALENDASGGTFLDPGLLGLFPRIKTVEGDIEAIPSFTDVLEAPDETLRIAGEIGFTYIDLGDGAEEDAGGISLPLLARYGDAVIPSFALQAVLAEEGLAPSDASVVLGEEIRAGERVRIPIDGAGRLRIYLGLREKVPHASAPDAVLGAEPDAKALLEPRQRESLAALSGRLLVVGNDDEHSRRIELPGGGHISRAELQALAIATMQSSQYIRRLPAAPQYGVWAAAAALGLFIVRAKRRGSAFFLSFLGVVLVFACGLVAFQSALTWYSPALPPPHHRRPASSSASHPPNRETPGGGGRARVAVIAAKGSSRNATRGAPKRARQTVKNPMKAPHCRSITMRR